MSLVAVAEPQTAEELYALYKRVLARRYNPGVFKSSPPKPAVVDVLAHRRAAEAVRKADEAARIQKAKTEAREALERSGGYGSRRRAIAITRAIAAEHQVSFADLLGPSRKANIVAARFEAIAAVSRALNGEWSLPRLGRFFGGRDHTTILNALQKTGAAQPRRMKVPTPETVVAAVIQARFRFGISITRIAEIQNISPRTVRHILAKHEAEQGGWR